MKLNAKVGSMHGRLVSDESSNSEKEQLPEWWLERALSERDPSVKERLARQGLISQKRLEADTHMLLLKQLHLAYFEQEKYDQALEASLRASDFGDMPDVMLQDAAKAAMALGHIFLAVHYLEKAVFCAPIERRSFQEWSLGSTYFLTKNYEGAEVMLKRASVKAGALRPLYLAHLALVRLAMGKEVQRLQHIVNELAAAPCGAGYGRFVLGHLAYASGKFDSAKKYLRSFLVSVERGEKGKYITLRGEYEMAKATIKKMGFM